MERDYIRTRLNWLGSCSVSFGPVANSVPHATAPRYSDEYIDYWAEVWADKNLMNYGILLETFLQHPHDILNGLEQLARHDHLPLLPEQRAVQSLVDALDAEATSEIERLSGAQCRNGQWVEPLHHHAWPRKSHTTG